MCWHVDMCWHVLTCVDMCWHVLTCVDMCWHVLTCVDIVDMCWHVLTCMFWPTVFAVQMEGILGKYDNLHFSRAFCNDSAWQTCSRRRLVATTAFAIHRISVTERLPTNLFQGQSMSWSHARSQFADSASTGSSAGNPQQNQKLWNALQASRLWPLCRVQHERQLKHTRINMKLRYFH